MRNNEQIVALAGGASVRGCIHEDLGQPNQDTFLIDEKHRIFAIFDGHGDQGHVVASDIKQRLVEQFTTSLNRASSVEDAFVHAFSVLDHHVCSQKSSNSSGSTATIAYVEDDHLYLAAVGDCSAHLVQIDPDSDDLSITSLFSPHKPEDPGESERVKASGGKIEGEYVVHPDDDCKMINITRAFGDQDLKSSGIISVPVVNVRKIDRDLNMDTFLVLFSDGLECIPKDKIVTSAYLMIDDCMHSDKDLNAMCGRLLSNLEKSMYGGDVYFSDDTTVVVVLLRKNQDGLNVKKIRSV